MIEDLGRVHFNSLSAPEISRASLNRKDGAVPLPASFVCNIVLVLSPYAPRRIVSLQPSATAILRDLGRLSNLVACTKYCVDVCPEVLQSNIAIVADSWTAQSSQITDAHPDLVIAAVPYQEKAVGEILKSGSRFLGLAPQSLADIYGDIAAIAGIMNARKEGERVISKMQDEIESVRRQTENLPKPRVFCEEWGKPLIASQHWVAELVHAVGGEFIGTPGAQISAEEVASESPDVLIAAWCGAGDRVPLEKIVQTRAWEKIPAAKNHRVFCIRDEYLNTPAPTLVKGLHALAAAIHPECFPHAEGLRCIEQIQ